jgi:DoxX-like family
MFTGYVTVAVLAAVMNLWAASQSLRRAATPVQNAAKVEVPSSWVVPLGALLLAGGVGLLAGIAVPLIGAAAAVGLVLYFVCAIFAHLRVHWFSTVSFPAVFLSLAVAALALRLASVSNVWDLAPRLAGG